MKSSHFPFSSIDNAQLLRTLEYVYRLINKGVDEAIELRREQTGALPACGKGCCVCCINQVIPVSHPEMAGVFHYAATSLSVERQQTILDHLTNLTPGSLRCPFLLTEKEGKICSIYPMRPIACRQYHVYNFPCRENEDAMATRPSDVLIPNRKWAHRVFSLLLPYYGIQGTENIQTALKANTLPRMSVELTSHDFSMLIQLLSDSIDSGL